ncbi:hypothetical protein EV424DRAFT_1343243 [Suillus variegatus]|nr:hypothetical protein EV424DRAFT_1343243 [Suillus variegatus]
MILSETDPSLAWIFRMLPSQQKHFHGPHPVHNHFITGLLSAEATAAFHVMVTPDQKSFTVPNLQYTYGLPDFAVALTEYINVYIIQIKAMPADEPSVGIYRVKQIFYQDETGWIF